MYELGQIYDEAEYNLLSLLRLHKIVVEQGERSERLKVRTKIGEIPMCPPMYIKPTKNF
jgi:hypothetical protein